VDNSFERVITQLTANREAAERNTAEIKRLATQLTAGATVNMVGCYFKATAPRSGPPARRGGFTAGQRGSRWGPPAGAQRAKGPPMNVPQQSRQFNAPRATTSGLCGNCGGVHNFGRQFCRATDVGCYNCGRRGQVSKTPRGKFYGRSRLPPGFLPSGVAVSVTWDGSQRY